MPPSQSQTKSRKFGVGGAGVCAPPPPPSSNPLMRPFQIPCSIVVTKLICNSCAPLPRPDSEKLKRGSQSLGCCRSGPMLLGWCEFKVNEKVQNTGEPMPYFFLRCGLYRFSSIFFKFQAPPPPHPLHKGSAVSLDIGLIQNWIATAVSPPPLENLTIAPRGRQENAK